MNIHDLYSKPVDYKFNKDELKAIKAYLRKDRHNIRCRYAFYRKKSSKGCYIAFIIDQDFNAVRRSGVENYWEYICDRPISDIEFEELAENWGCDIKRFKVWYYRDINYLIHEDLKYNVDTPSVFVNEAIKRGYVSSYQTKIDFFN